MLRHNFLATRATWRYGSACYAGSYTKEKMFSLNSTLYRFDEDVFQNIHIFVF